VALRALLERFRQPVFALCYRMVGHLHDAEDITQEVLTRVVRSLSCWDQSRPLRPWVMGIAVNRCKTFLRQRSRGIRACTLVEDVPEHRTVPERDDELAAALRAGLAELRPEYRSVVVMFYDQQMSLEEISQALGRPVGTIKTWLHRARGQLGRFLTARGYGAPDRAAKATT
jgi:RNA polymerase sigma-70 factor (ECF subfamily)